MIDQVVNLINIRLYSILIPFLQTSETSRALGKLCETSIMLCRLCMDSKSECYMQNMKTYRIVTYSNYPFLVPPISLGFFLIFKMNLRNLNTVKVMLPLIYVNLVFLSKYKTAL